jgi:hypothetical protein
LILWVSAALAAEIEVDVRARDSGDPIAMARATSGAHTATTDASGLGTVEVDGNGPWTVTIAADGWRPTQISVAPPADRPVRVWLEPGAGPLEVVVEGLKPVPSPTRYVVDGEQAAETPGTLDDAVRLVQSLPGVTVQREFSPGAGTLQVRGADPGDTRYFLDGIELPYLYHYNQYASVFPASQIGELELYPSTFSAAYGDSVGAIVDARSRLDPPEELHGDATVNFVLGGGDVKLPIGHRGWWTSASGRRSYLDLVGTSSAQYTVWPRFGDWVVRAEHGTADNGFGVFTFGAFDGYTRAVGELSVLDPVEASTTPYLDYRQGFEAVGARGQWSSPERNGRASVGLVHHGISSELSGPGKEELAAVDLTSRVDATWRTHSLFAWDVGSELKLSRTSLVVEPAGPDGLRVAEEAPALARNAAVDDDLVRLQGGIYGIAEAQTGPVRWMPGLRLDGDSRIAEVQVEPRGTVRWAVADQTMLKAGGGRYSERPATELLFPGAGDPDLPTTTSWQASAGVEQTFAGRLEVDVDLYRKWLANLVETPIGELPRTAPSGAAQGIELVTRYRLREAFFLWGWVALAQATVDEATGETVPASGDQRVAGGVVASWDLGRWNVGARYRYASGLPFTQLEGSVYDAGNDSWVPIPGPIDGDRLPSYHKVDLRLGHTWAFRGWTLEGVAEVWYVPRSSAQLYPTWNYDYSEQGWVNGPTVLPLLGARARF